MDYPTLVMETDVGAVAPGGSQFGWVSGSLASLAASASVSILFDLGPNWSKYAEVQIAIRPTAPSSGLSGVAITSRDDAVAASNAARQLAQRYGAAGAGNAAIFAAVTFAVGFSVRPMGRYLVISATNADATNAQGATSKVAVAAYAD